MNERRKYPRVSFRRGVLWRKINTLDNLDAARDVSEGGIGIITSTDGLKIEDAMPLEFQLPTGKVIHAKAQVRWVLADQRPGQGFLAGLEFSHISDEDRQNIRCFVGKCRYGCD